METQERLLDLTRQLSSARAQSQSIELEKRRIELTLSELKEVSADTKLYLSMGRMYV